MAGGLDACAGSSAVARAFAEARGGIYLGADGGEDAGSIPEGARMKFLFLTQTTELGPSSRYRVYQFLPALRAAGIESEVSPAILESEYTEYFGGSRLR